MAKKSKYKCAVCKKEMNIVSFLMNPVCLKCVRKAHKKAIGR